MTRTVFGVLGIVLAGFLMVRVGTADEGTETFRKANDYYKEGKYEMAREIYEALSKEHPDSWQISYDLGNVYFKLKQVGKSIASYERAKRLNPRSKQVRRNLAYVQGLLEYKIEDKRNWYWVAWLKLVAQISWNQAAMTCLLLYLAWIALVLFGFTSRGRFRILRLRKMILVLFLISTLPVITKYWERTFFTGAVVTSSETEMRYGPSENDKVAMKLVEGLGVRVRKIRGDWFLVSLDNGEIGWCQKKDIEII